MGLILNWIRKLFLVKEIISKQGVVHFRRYELLSTPWFNLYIHHILESDQDQDLHDHPWDFQSLIMKGAYLEIVKTVSSNFTKTLVQMHLPGDVVSRNAEDAHKIKLLSESVWTLVLTSKPHRDWGYRKLNNKEFDSNNSTFIDHISYRKIKNNV